MSPANPTQSVNAGSVNRDELELLEFVHPHAEWFISEDGRLPLEVNRAEFDFYVAHGRLIFSCWTQRGARAWRVTDWNRSGEKLVLQVSRRMGAEVATLKLVPRASAKALVATIAAARQARCEVLAQLVAQTLVCDSFNQDHRLKSVPLVKIEQATLSPGMRHDQPGRYARIILRLPHERIAVTGT